MAQSIDRTGWTVDDLADLADGPAMVKELADQVAASIGAVSCTSTARPTTGLYEGMLAFETDTKRCIRRTGTGWSYVSVQCAQGGAKTHNYGGGIGPVSSAITFDVPFTAPPALALSANDARFVTFYNGRSSTGFTLMSQANTSGITATLDVSWVAVGTI